MQIRRSLVFFLTLLLTGMPAAHGATKAVRVCGTGDSQALLRRLAAAYEARHPTIRMEVPDSIGSAGGIRATASGRCDMGRTARTLRNKEKRYGLRYRAFARSPVVFMASGNQTAVATITAQQVMGVFSGRISNWQELGGSPGKIYVASREKGDSSRTNIEKYLTDFSLIKNMAGKTLYSTPQTVDTVARYDNTIAYGPLSAARKRSTVRVLAFEGVVPSVASLSAGNYPLYSEYGLVWRSDRARAALDFLAFLNSAEARQIIVSYGAAPVRAAKK